MDSKLAEMMARRKKLQEQAEEDEWNPGSIVSSHDAGAFSAASTPDKSSMSAFSALPGKEPYLGFQAPPPPPAPAKAPIAKTQATMQSYPAQLPVPAAIHGASRRKLSSEVIEEVDTLLAEHTRLKGSHCSAEANEAERARRAQEKRRQFLVQQMKQAPAQEVGEC
mmetsp:Transcript_24452/g.58238  ORF Transcript_24452/g.58238 Transcript_24452/m.58238 type:complete len:166 (-) Transcript_24452:547-1044(-)